MDVIFTLIRIKIFLLQKPILKTILMKYFDIEYNSEICRLHLFL